MAEAALVFFIGTEAELIKLFPVIQDAAERRLPVRIVASGQNDIKRSSVLASINGGHVDVELSDPDRIQKTAFGLLRWYVKTRRSGVDALKKALPAVDFPRSVMVVHGDTVSTLMGAAIGRKLHMCVAHVEAGLRSHNLLNPFPEEMARILTDRYSQVCYCPGATACRNLSGSRAEIVDTRRNTMADSLAASKSVPAQQAWIAQLQAEPYFLFVLHRQENIANRALMERLYGRAADYARSMHGVILLHEPTRAALERFGLLETVRQIPNTRIIARQEYFDFMKLLSGAQYVITDGGSNQEELACMGKPCMIIRTHTERDDGLGKNAFLYGGDLARVDEFVQHYPRYAMPETPLDESPSRLIAGDLMQRLEKRSAGMDRRSA